MSQHFFFFFFKAFDLVVHFLEFEKIIAFEEVFVVSSIDHFVGNKFEDVDFFLHK
jgi:hypothetical protein